MAVKKKKKEGGGGAPEWMVTYGDMVTLLLTFFVLLLAMSEVKQDQKMMEFMQAIKEAFGYTGGVRQLPTEEVEVPKNVNEARMLVMAIQPKNLGYTNDLGPRGKRTKVSTRPRGEEYLPGGTFRFPELSAKLGETERQRLAEYAQQLRGYTTLIEVHGYCSKRPVTGTPFKDHLDLAYQRARAAAQVLLANGIDERRIKLVAAGTTQPIAPSVPEASERRKNDIVELIQIDQSIDEFSP